MICLERITKRLRTVIENNLEFRENRRKDIDEQNHQVQSLLTENIGLPTLKYFVICPG